MAITFKRDFIIAQLTLAIGSTEETLDDWVQLEIDNRKRNRQNAIELRDNFVSALSKVKYKGKPEDVRREVGAIYTQYGHGQRYLLETMLTDEQIKQQVTSQYPNQRGDRVKKGYTRALDTLKASNAENVSFTDLKQLGILGIETYGVKAITVGPDTDADGVTEHTEE